MEVLSGRTSLLFSVKKMHEVLPALTHHAESRGDLYLRSGAKTSKMYPEISPPSGLGWSPLYRRGMLGDSTRSLGELLPNAYSAVHKWAAVVNLKLSESMKC